MRFMSEIQSRGVFNQTILILSILSFIDAAYQLAQPPEHQSVFVLRMTILAVSVLAISSFFYSNSHKEFYTWMFILINLITIPLTQYFRFLQDLLYYFIARFELISNPIIHIKLLLGMVLFYYSIQHSTKAKLQREKEYGIAMISYGLFLTILNAVKMLHSEVSVFQFVWKFLLGSGIAILGNGLRIEKIKLKSSVLIFAVLLVLGGIF